MELNNLNGYGYPDLFDFVPDPIVLQIFNKVSDIKSLNRCRAVSKRFNSLAPQSDSLLLRVDRVVSDSGSDPSLFLTLFKSIFKCFHPFNSPKKQPILVNPARPENSPVEILNGFESIRSLQIELPASDLKLDKESNIKWTAHFGKTLKSCVILGFRTGDELDFTGSGLKTRVVWAITSLIAASVRHHMMLDVVKEQNDLTNLVVKDKDNEGTIIMDKIGLNECRLSEKDDEELINGESNSEGLLGIWCKSKRTKVPAVRMRVRHLATIELSDGVKLEGATLVVIRPVNAVGARGGKRGEVEEHGGDVGLAMDAFGGDRLYKEAMEKLLKSKSYVLEMNSF